MVKRITDERIYMEIDLDALRGNYLELRKKLDKRADIIATIKADAYGLGALQIGLELEKAGCGRFAVTFLEEAKLLRRGGIRGEILVMNPIEPDEIAAACELGVETAFTSAARARLLSDAAFAAGIVLRGEIKLDTGLGRLGIPVCRSEETAAAEAEEIFSLAGLRVEGVFTHITAASAVPGSDALNRLELERFKHVTDALEKEGRKFKRHCLCSYPLTLYPEYTMDAVRVASILYGCDPSGYPGFDIKPILTLRARIIEVKTVPAGTPIGYGPLFVTLRETRVAVTAIGFADGLRRSVSNRGHMLVHGCSAPIIGKVCCDHTMLDVTDIPDVSAGDMATVFGTDADASQTVADYEALYPATAAELTSELSPRIPRYYSSNGSTLRYPDE